MEWGLSLNLLPVCGSVPLAEPPCPASVGEYAPSPELTGCAWWVGVHGPGYSLFAEGERGLWGRSL